MSNNSRMLVPIPLEQCLNAYQQVVMKFGFAPVIQPGRIQLLDWDLEYVCGAALASLIDSILVRRLNDLIPDNDQPVILDCGANIGFSVLNYKRQFPQSRIIAFEPDPQFVPVLRRNLERNGAGDVQVVEAAAWVSEGQAQWFCEGIDGSHLVDAPATNSVTVQTVDLARYLAEPVDLVKLDIEGSEYKVLAHLGERLRNVKNILIECHFDQTTVVPFGEMLRVLAAAGLKVSVNSFGAWRDLIRQKPVSPNHWEQYLLVAGWRGSIPLASPEESPLPYTGVQPQIALHTAHIEMQELWNTLASAQSDLRSRDAMLVARETELAGREQQLFQSLRPYFVIGRQAIESRVLTAPFSDNNGRCWTVMLPDLESGADNEEYTTRSTLLLFEDENPLGPAHSLHDDIRNMGSGRFSHWKTNLWFSTPDNSDPNTNGRTYTIVFVNAAQQSALDIRERELAARETTVATREDQITARESKFVVCDVAMTKREAQVTAREQEVSARQVAYDSLLFVRLGRWLRRLFRQ